MQMLMAASRASDYFRNRAYFVALGFGFEVLGFAMLLGGNPDQHSLRYAALVFATIGVASKYSTSINLVNVLKRGLADLLCSSYPAASDLGRRERRE